MKDSTGVLGEFVRTARRTNAADFELVTGDASILAQALAVGASGGILALANLLPERTAAVVDAHEQDPEQARRLNAALVDLNAAVTAEYGIPGLKWAMRDRGAPAGYLRSPHRRFEGTAPADLRAVLDAVAYHSS